MGQPSISGTSGAYRALEIVSILETASLVVILVNRFTVHAPIVTSTGGPLHGILYLGSILLAVLSPLPTRTKWLAVIPAFGGVLAVVVARRRRHVAPVPAGRLVDDPAFAVIARDLWVERRGRRLLGPIELALPRGAVIGLIGPNGAGKTTTLRALTGLVSIDRGQLQLLDEAGPAADPAAFRAVRTRIGSLIEGPALFDTLTGEQNLAALARLSGLPQTAVDRALERVAFGPRRADLVRTYSLGMRQRLALAAALLSDPALLILDEPTNGLDPEGRQQLLSLLRAESDRGTTVVLSSHLLEDVEEVCDHLVLLQDGIVQFSGKADALAASREVTLAIELADAVWLSPLVEQLASAGWSAEIDARGARIRIRADRTDAVEINRIAVGCGAPVVQLQVEQAGLRDVFLAVTRMRQPSPTAALQTQVVR